MATNTAVMEEHCPITASDSTEAVNLTRRCVSGGASFVPARANKEVIAPTSKAIDLREFPANVRWMVGAYET